MVSRKVSRKSHRRLGETEAAELKAARRLVKEEDARKARDHRIEAWGVPPSRQDPTVRKRRRVQSHAPSKTKLGSSKSFERIF